MVAYSIFRSIIRPSVRRYSFVVRRSSFVVAIRSSFVVVVVACPE
jgi:hypothetical protein